MTRQIVWWSVLTLIFPACQSTSSPEIIPESYQVTVPANFPPLHYTFDQNPVSKEGFELGRMLFYDTRLSKDGTVSCGSCHRQLFAFADHTHDLSHGVDGKLGKRNTPALFNLAWQREFFWDGGANHLEISPLNALTDPAEMGETLENVIAKLNALPEYREQFKAVFGKEAIDSQPFFRALAQFTGSLVSASSRYDQYKRGENQVAFTEQEREGLQLFTLHCAPCHATDLFTDQSYRNNGLNTQFKDLGRETITSDLQDRGKFRVPSLRNIALTAPYMHDGRFKTLEQVLTHYSSGVKDSPTLDPQLKKDGQLGISLSGEEKNKLLAFLHTLTDPAFCADPRFKDPFTQTEDK